MRRFGFLSTTIAVLGMSFIFANGVSLAENETASIESAGENLAVSAECHYFEPEEIDYSAELVAVRRKFRVEEDENFRVKFFVKNTGNVPWFSENSNCVGPKMSLGTDKKPNRESEFYSPDVKEKDNNWTSASRVGMDQNRVNPGRIASFTFWVDADDAEGVYKEYFTPLINNVIWLDEAQGYFDVIIGQADEKKSELRRKLLYASNSGSVSDINLDGEKELLVDLSEQKLYVKLDGDVIREFQVSTGARATPTPKGEYSIKLKQDVRVGGKAPHYIMPKFMWFRDGGYGFHALPSLRTDGGKFWTEAREHIGIPVSHGCIRLLPEDADFTYEFADIGTTVMVQA